MGFVSIPYYLFLGATVVLYYLFPLRHRWLLVLVADLLYYSLAGPEGLVLLGGMTLLSYVMGLALEKVRRGPILLLALAVTLAPLLAVKTGWLWKGFFPGAAGSLLAPLGLSFFTLQMVAYLADVYQGKIKAQKNPLKYALFVSFFPQMVQGPIPRYIQLMPQLLKGHRFDPDKITRGLQLILWGFFLKMVIADRAAVVVNQVFDQWPKYQGLYVLAGGILYSLQLYADFQACTKLAQGSAWLLGVPLVENFRRPYLSSSVKEFWGRWHLSLSYFLRDYVYIPLGGNRKGRLRKYGNVLVTFLVSGLWHGNGPQFLVWGLLHGGYQTVGELTQPVRDWLWQRLGVSSAGTFRRWTRRLTTCFLVMVAWVIFRAPTLGQGLEMLGSMATAWNPWVLLDDSLLALGLSWKDWGVLVLATGLLLWVSCAQERGYSVRTMVNRQPLVVRWLIYILAVLAIALVGVYGYGYSAQDFIYGGF